MEKFSAKENDTVNQFFGDLHKNNFSEKVIDEQLCEKIKELIIKYKKDLVEKGDSVISAWTGLDFGNIEIYKVISFDQGESFKLDYSESDSIRISMKCESSIILWTDFSEVEPFNRQSNFYVGSRFSNLNLVRETAKWREFKANFSKGGNCSLPLDVFRYSDLWHTVKFGICIAGENTDIFIKELRVLLGKNLKQKLSYVGGKYYLNGVLLSPEESQKIHNHSPDGFNHGYGGSGPAQLALAIMLKLTGKADGYQDFKSKTIASIPMGEDFEIEFEL